jgi:monovalent cation/proton antiporter MnhG/PhaG subunit
MSMIAQVLLWLGVVLGVAAGVGLLVLPGLHNRIHLSTLVSTAALPLVCVSLAVTTGASRAAVKLLIIGLLLALTGPAVTTATGQAYWRLAHTRRRNG